MTFAKDNHQNATLSSLRARVKSGKSCGTANPSPEKTWERFKINPCSKPLSASSIKNIRCLGDTTAADFLRFLLWTVGHSHVYFRDKHDFN